MGKQKKTEEEQIKSIFDTYSQLREESSFDRRQVYLPQLLEKIVKWSIDCFYKEETLTYWLEIHNAVHRIVKAEDTREMPKNEQELIKYLKVSLYHAKVEYIKKYEGDNIHIPKGQMQKLKEITEFIRMEESELGRELSEHEKVKKTAEWFNIPEDKAREYLDQIIHMKSTGSLIVETYSDGAGQDTNILDFVEIHPNNQKESNDPEEILIINLDTSENRQKFLEVMESVFASRQEKTRSFYRALFTAQCLDTSTGVEWLDDNFEWLNEYLDREILEVYKKTGKMPANREIYIKYYPDNNTPDESASNRLREFRKLLKTAQEEKGLKFFTYKPV